MKRIVLGLALAGIAVLPAPASAQTGETTQEFLDYCNGVGDFGIFGEGFCAGYLAGVLDTQALIQDLGNTRYYCLPDQGISPDMAKTLLENYVLHNPNEAGEGALGSLFIALAEKYPCT